MICDNCGYNMTSGVRCPNCYHDNSNTDYTPDEIVYLVDGGMVAVDAEDVKEGHEFSPEKEIPIHCLSSDLLTYAHYSRKNSFFTLIVVVFFGSLYYQYDKSDQALMLTILISLIVILLLEVILSSFIVLGKEWILGAYIPFTIITFPLLIIWEVLTKEFNFPRTKCVWSSHFFVNDFRDYLKYRRMEKEEKDIERS